MKLTLGADFDAEGLDNAEYDDTDFPSYDGPLPRSGAILVFRLSKMWQRFSSNGDLQFKTVLTAEGGEFEGLTIWDNVTFTESAAFRYRPWLLAFGLTAKGIKRSTILEDDEGRFGHLVLSVGKWRPGSDEALCRVKVVRGQDQEGEPRPEAGKYLPLEDDGEAERPGDSDAGDAPAVRQPQQRPAAKAKARPAAANDDDDLFGDDPPF